MCGCPRDRLCDLCRGGLYDNLRGTAATRGELWAERVAKSRDHRRVWWPDEGRAHELALEQVEDLTRDPRLREQLAAELARWAARRWLAFR